MKKRIIVTLVAIVGMIASAMAADRRSHDVNVLPQAARVILADHFKAKVSVIKIDEELGRIKDYEVILTDGSEITFDRDGNWKEVEVVAKKSVPQFFIPSAISVYIKSSHPGQKVIGIEKSRKGYEVELVNGLDLKFDAMGRFLKYDK